MLRAYASFGESVWESCSKQAELKAIVFSLCFFHSVVCERRKFGPIGWNNGYPFNQGDLSVCIAVANNYLDNSSKVRRRALATSPPPPSISAISSAGPRVTAIYATEKPSGTLCAPWSVP